MTDNRPDRGGAPADDGLPLTRETLLALRDGRLPREQARDVRARLSRDPDALTLLGALSAEIAAEKAPASHTPRAVVGPPGPAVPEEAAQPPGSDREDSSAGEQTAGAGPTAMQRAVVVALAAALLVGALWWAGAAAVEPLDPRAAPVVPELTMGQLGTLWPAIDGRFDRDLLEGRDTRCQPFRTPLGAQGAVVDGRYSMVVAYTADGTLRDDEIALVVVPLNCNDSDYYPRVTVPR